MDQKTWTDVDVYFESKLIKEDKVLEEVSRANLTAGLPPIDVAPNQGKLLHLLARMKKSKNILEIGTLGGYSTIWLARALAEGGRLVTLEYEEKHAEIARKNIIRAGLADSVEIIVGAALNTLPHLLAQGRTFDFIFIDADKPNNPHYLEWALKLSQPGAVIVGDNVVRQGCVTDGGSDDPKIQGVREFIDLLARDPRIDSTAIQTVGSKGYDGFAMGIVKE
ncbi:O-methyltransferase [Peribacillus kribbensis]|uniref:O-methyltransferase n=1 Tax=Peribacillus kribbensis TaxID=356658 RepID=UPI00041C6795|nr:O-methyltransferase [Peribacillus kribbensis]